MMTLIKGGHGRPTQAESSALFPESVDQPNRSFRYLTIDSTKQNLNALLPQGSPAEVAKTIAALHQLAEAMIDEADTSVRNSKIPAVYTYWGQFIDHDITAGTDRASNEGENLLNTDILKADFTPQPPQAVEKKITNLRLPRLDLDSVYGAEEGPHDPDAFAAGIYETDKIHLALGHNEIGAPGSFFDLERIPNPELDPVDTAGNPAPRRDLPRHPLDPAHAENGFEPKIGDARNDENTIVAQFHTAFLHFHNAVVSWLDQHPELRQDPIFDAHDKFSVARQIVTWTYQWLVVNDYLEHVAQQQTVREIVAAEDGFFALNQEFMPLEFSVAAFRFGHSMIRNDYDFNMNFGARGNLPAHLQPILPSASLLQLFQFTGKGQFLNNATLPVNWIIEWDRFTHVDPAFPARSAQKIDTNLATRLGQLDVPNDASVAINKHLARRNLLRGYLLNVPIGQHVADYLAAAPLTTELIPGDKQKVKTALLEGGFVAKTPLWYYVLREAEVQTQGESLGEVGTKLVAGTLVGLIKSDPASYINKQWDPSHATAVKLPDGQEIRSIMQFFQFAGVAPKIQVPAMAA